MLCFTSVSGCFSKVWLNLLGTPPGLDPRSSAKSQLSAAHPTDTAIRALCCIFTAQVGVFIMSGHYSYLLGYHNRKLLCYAMCSVYN